MRLASCSLFDRLRASRLLPVVLLLLAFAGAMAGFHAASHLGENHAVTAPLSQDDDGGAAAQHAQCAVCRLLGAWSFALVPAAGVQYPPVSAGEWAPPAIGGRVLAADAAARWRQRLKHGPPTFPR